MYNANEVMSIMVAAEKAYNEIAANANNGWKTFVNVIDANWNGQDACMVKTNLGDILHTVYNEIENSLSVFRANLYGVVGRMLSVQGETAKLGELQQLGEDFGKIQNQIPYGESYTTNPNLPLGFQSADYATNAQNVVNAVTKIYEGMQEGFNNNLSSANITNGGVLNESIENHISAINSLLNNLNSEIQSVIEPIKNKVTGLAATAENVASELNANTNV